MDMPLIGGDKIRSLIKNATKDSSTGSNESLTKTNTRDANNTIKNNDQLEMDKKNKIIVDNLKKSGGIVNKTQGIIGDLKKSEQKNMGGGINTNLQQKPIDTEITKTRGLATNTNIETPIPNQGRFDITMSEEEKNKGRLGNEYMGAEYYTKNSEEMGKAVNDLYKVVNNVLSYGQDVNIGKIREKFPEFGGIGDDVLNSMITDVKNMVNDGNDNLKELVDAYPELGYVSNIDLGYNGRVELINGMLNDDDGILDWVLDKLGVGGLVERKTGKTIKDNLANWANSSHEKKKAALMDNELEDAFIKDLQERYKQYTNDKGEWLPNATDEIKKQYKKEWDKYEYKGAFRTIGNFFKGLPSYLELGYNMVNHLPDMVKALGQLGLGLTVKGGEKLDDITRLNGLDKRAQARGYENWDEMKEIAYENMGEKGGWFNEFVIGSDLVTDKMLDYFDDTYGGMLKGDMTKVSQSIQERGEDVLSDAMMVLDALNGVGKATGLISPETSSKLRQVTNLMDPANLGVDIVTGGTKALAKAEARAITKTLGKGMKAISGGKDVLEKSFIGRGAEMVINQLTNLTKEERDFIKNNYDIVEEYLRGNRNAEDIAELIRTRMDDLLEDKRGVGDFYDFIKNNDKAIVKTAGAIDGIKKMLDNMGIKVGSDGLLKFGDLSYTPAQQRQLQQVYSYIRALENLGDNATAKDVRRARQLIDSLADWEGHSRRGLDAEVTNSIRDMRGKIDDALKEQVEGFREADSGYRELSNLVKELRKDWFDKEGNLKDASLSKIRNLTRAGNEAKLERLEKHFPGITESLKGLAVAQSVEKAGKAMVGQYAKQVMTVGGIFGLISGDLSLATALLGMAILTPKNLVKILKMQNNFENVWKRIANKLDNGEVLSVRDNSRLKKWLRRNEVGIRNNVEEAMKSKDWEQIDMDRVNLEYDKAQSKAYLGGKSTEKKLTKEERASLLKKYAKGSENNGFVMKIVEDMGEGTHGMADLDRKLVKLEENFGDTTAQHEFFHELFSVIDEDTKKYVINEVKNYLGLTDDVAAEERLAESFGIYARRREIKLGNIRLKGNRLQRFRSRISDLFQRAYEWIQDYSMDRKTINKLFNEVYGAVDGKVLDETGKFNLAEKLGINEKSSKLGGLEGEGLRYKKTGNLGKNDYTTTNGQEDRLLLGGLAATEGGMKQATHAEGGLGNRGPKNAHLERVSSSDTANFFELKDKRGKGYIEYNNGGGKVEKLYKQHELFDGYSEKLNKGLSKYKENLVKINDELAKNSSKKTSAVIGKTGHGKDIMISKEGLSHIYKHGNLDFNTLINAINDPTNQKQEVMGGRYRLEVRLDDGDTLVVGLQPKERVKGGRVKDVNSRVDADLYTVTSVTKGKPRGAESLEVRLKRDAKGRELSKGQQEYFKDSKVRDVNGGLLRMFHGTPNKGINVFDKSKIGTSTDSGVWGRGFYFTPDESYAKTYTKRNGNIGELKEAYIDIKKPFEIDLNDKATIDKFNESYMKYSPNLEDVWKKGLQKKYGELIDQGYEKGTQDLKDAGYDGVIVKRGGEIKEVVAFEPNQIKNIDNLNPSISDDIRYKKTGKGEGVDYNSTNLYGKIDQNGLTKKEGGSFGKLGAKGLSQGNGLDRGANKGVLQETSLTKLGASKGGDGTSQKLVNVKDGSEMVKISQNLQNKQERGAFMDVHSAEEYNTYKNFTNKNKSATISVKPDGDIINFVSTEKGAGKDLMLRAIEEGGNKMDNYGVGLTSYYENFGFEPVARVKFNREYAPNNWNFVRDGEPDIFVMKHNGDSVDVVREKYGTYKHKTPEELDKLPVMEYDDALKYRDELQAKEGKGLRYKKAYHGSPADFDKFDSSHMSEGEGHQAHGWGHYIAVDEKTGRHYADMKGEWQYKYDGKDIDWHSGFTDNKQYAINSVLNELQKRSDNGVEFDAKKVIEDKRRAWNDRIRGLEESKTEELAEGIANDGYYDNQIKKYKGWLKGLDEIDVDKIEQKRGRNLYEVEIPDPVKKDTPTGSNYLEEDGKITDKELYKFRELLNKEYDGRGDRFLEGAIYDKVHNGKSLYKELSYMFGEKGASKKLEEWGYDGIHYFGGKDGEAYVIFNDDAPQIQNHIRYKRAYHGSPAEFDRFDMEHMGEGEGGASHGWGLYFAKDKNIAKERYAERSHKYGISYEGGTLEEIKKKADEKGFYNLDIKDRVAYRLMNETKGDNMFNRFVDFDSAKEKSLSLIDDKISLAEYVIKNKGKDSITDKIYNEAMDSLPKLKEEKKVISNMKNGDFGIGEAKDRNLYAVDIPDEIKKDTPTGSNYFRESRTYNKQELGAILEKFKEKYPDKYDLLKNKFNTPLHGRRVYTSIADVLGGQKQASKFLESIGYDGVYAKGYIDKDVYVMFNNKGLDVKDHIRYKKDQTKTPEFRKWFEGSKVVKADGKPQVVYHGTTADFNIFNKIGGAGIYGDGYYFTDKIGTAKNYGADGGKVMKVYLDIKNPYEATMKDQYGLNVKKLKEQGYDGVKAKLGNETYWVAFDSNQIKSATDNVGTFDKSNPDIRYKKDSTDKRKDSYKMGLSRKAGNKLWEESINPSTGKKWTKEEIDKAVLDFKDEVLGDEKKLKQVYNEYIKNDELGEDVRDVFDIKGYINPDAVRPVVNRMLSEKYGVSDNILASVNHPASSKIADGIRDMIYDKSIEKAKKGEKVVVSTISGGGGSGKSKGPKALIKNGYIKDGKVDITLDVQKGADDLKLLIDKARKEGVLDKYEFDVAYVYAPVEDASKGVGIRTANQNAKGLGALGRVFNIDRIVKELGWGDAELNRVYEGRSLPMSVFEEGHKKSAGEKGLQGFVKMSEEMDNLNLIITKRNGKGVDVVNVKKGGEFLIDKGELTKLVDEINTNKNGGINMDRIKTEMKKLYDERAISKRQYMNLISGLGLFVIFFGGGSEE